MNFQQLKELTTRIEDNVEKAIVGKRDVLEQVMIAILCNGHVLLEDVPGTGKTTLAKAFSRTLGVSYNRVQFTPDLLPSDLSGVNFFDMKTQEFRFKPGPVFTNVLLADEINRATPRTQSSLLEAMEEFTVSLDGVTHKLESPFFVIATQNPVEIQGTFPLPEAQLDRFFIKLAIGYPAPEFERQMLTGLIASAPVDSLEAVTSREEIVEAQQLIKTVRLSEPVKQYIVDIANATRSDSRVRLGISPRGSLALMRAAQAYAAMDGRDYVRPDDVKAVGLSIMGHRIITRGSNLTRSGSFTKELIDGIFERVPAPIEQQA